MIITFIACKREKANPKIKSRRVTTGDVIAEGEISSDTVFNGLIKFYDTSTNKLAIEAFYKNGKPNGKRKDYYLNGKVKDIAYYENGKQNGTVSYFDSLGRLTSKQDFYYGLKVGSSIEYKNEKPSKYYFYSFDNEQLFYTDYDSVYHTNLKKINDDNFFFWHIDSVATIRTTDRKSEGDECFIYLINPPNFNFTYSLCLINSKDSILRVEKKFDTGRIWDTFFLEPTKLVIGERFALRLSFDRGLPAQERKRIYAKKIMKCERQPLHLHNWE